MRISALKNEIDDVRYMDSGLADKLLEGGDDLLGGTSVATVLFSDIQKLYDPDGAARSRGHSILLNEYFSVMVDCIQDGGMLDKFIGDAMMAIFGTPFPHEDDPDRAMRAAIRMMRELNDFNARRAKKGQMEFFTELD